MFRSFWRRTFPASLNVADQHFSALSVRVDENNALLREVHSLLRTTKTSAIADDLGGVGPEEIKSVVRLLEPSRARNVTKKRLGSRNDGGYVMLDAFDGVTRALSLGIDVNDDWDRDVAALGIPVDQYDDSIAAAPTVHPLIKFHRKRVTTASSAGSVTLAELLEADEVFLLKMDIEGSEWDCIASTPPEALARCRQITCEFHGFGDFVDQPFRQRAHDVFTRLRETHVPVHVHANNYAPLRLVAGIPLPEVLEVTFAARAHFEIEPSNEEFPCEQDAPNDPRRHDLVLGTFKF